MPFPDEPCPHCPRVARGLAMPCRAMVTRHARFCVLAEAGDRGYVALLCDEVPPAAARPVAATDREAILRRRAGKVRLPLGVRPTGRDPGRR